MAVRATVTQHIEHNSSTWLLLCDTRLQFPCSWFFCVCRTRSQHLLTGQRAADFRLSFPTQRVELLTMVATWRPPSGQGLGGVGWRAELGEWCSTTVWVAVSVAVAPYFTFILVISFESKRGHAEESPLLCPNRAMRRSVCNARASNGGWSLCVQISKERSYPRQYIDTTRKAIDCATTVPLTVFM